MNINATMDLDDLAERMGPGATESEAIGMRDMLVADYDGHDTDDIDPGDWLAMLDQVSE